MAAVGTHTLVSITPYTEAEMQHATFDYGELKALKRASFRVPAAGSALIVAPAPDYSTPAAVTKRCREAGTGCGADIRAAGNDRTVAKAYRDLRPWCRRCPAASRIPT